MDAKKIRKSFSRAAARLGLKLCSLIIKAIPTRWLYGFARALGAFGYGAVAKQRKVALESLSIAFGSARTKDELQQIARDCFIFMATSAIELMFLMDRPRELQRRVAFEGKENLDKALARGSGVILVSGHFGNFPLMMARLSLAGFQVNGIMRPMRDEKVEKIFLEKRNRLGVKTIYSQPRKTCVEGSIRCLRNNELLFIPIDQNFGTAGVFVDFFGTKAATATGPVILALRTKALLLPCFIIRQDNDMHKIVFEPALDLAPGVRDEDFVVSNIQRLTSIIEMYIRRYPAQWSWMHRRWKSRPAETSR